MNGGYWGFAALAVMTVVVVACDRGREEVSPGAIEVRGGELYFDPVQLTVRAGEEVTVNLRNVGSDDHTWVVLGAGQWITTGEVSTLDEGSVTFTIDHPGAYRVICGVPGHREAGMEGTLIVE
ncbi:MAG: cupredoxin domain-containing protein [Anaerolineae bacterium]